MAPQQRGANGSGMQGASPRTQEREEQGATSRSARRRTTWKLLEKTRNGHRKYYQREIPLPTGAALTDLPSPPPLSRTGLPLRRVIGCLF